MTNKTSFTSNCSEDEYGNLVFEIPDDLLIAMGWKGGTTLDISVVGDRIILREIKSDDPKETV